MAAFVSTIAIRANRLEAQDEVYAIQSELQFGRAMAANQVEIIDAQSRVIAVLMKAEATERIEEKKAAIAEARVGMEDVQKVYRRLEISAQGAQDLSK